MTIQRNIAPWRKKLLPASFRGVEFHVEQQSRSSGRRVVLHEFPKRDKPYAEDMGRLAARYQMAGYIIGRDYQTGKEALIAALETEGGGNLVDPYMPRQFQAICERYNVTEVREKGGYCLFEMLFTEVGSPGNSPMFGKDDSQKATNDTAGEVQKKADEAGKAAADSTNQAAKEVGTGVPSLVGKPTPGIYSEPDTYTTGGWF